MRPGPTSRGDSENRLPGKLHSIILAYLGEPARAPRIALAARGPPWQGHYDPREVGAFAMSAPVPAYWFDPAGELVSGFRLGRFLTVKMT